MLSSTRSTWGNVNNNIRLGPDDLYSWLESADDAPGFLCGYCYIELTLEINILDNLALTLNLSACYLFT